MKHPYLYGALAVLLVVGIFLTGYNYALDTSYKAGYKAGYHKGLFWCSQSSGQISGGYNLQEIQK